MSKSKGYRRAPLALPPTPTTQALADMVIADAQAATAAATAAPSRPAIDMGPSQGREYPLPSYALGVWLVGGELKVSVPGQNGAGAHTLSLPIEKLATTDDVWCRGWVVLLDMLKQQERAKRSAATIGTKAAPSQYQIDGALVKRYDAKGEPEVTFDDLFGEG